MKKSLLISSFLCSLVLLSTFAFAIGTSTSGDVRVGRTGVSTTVTVEANASVDCEAGISVRERIACRIRTHVDSAHSIEESCRRLADPDACVRFQRGAHACYNEPAREKAACLREHVGIARGEIKEAAHEERRKYAALLFYELQERVEAKQEAGAITDEQAADLITSIVDIKESLLNGTSMVEVSAKIRAFKQQWAVTMNSEVSS